MRFKNAKYDNAEHSIFTVCIELDSGEEIPFSYFCDGSDDHSGEVAAAVGAAYRAGEIEVSEFEPVEIPREVIEQCARRERDWLLSQTDYCAMPDYPITQEQRAELATYRQALRDITVQTGFPDSIEWPVKPAWIK